MIILDPRREGVEGGEFDVPEAGLEPAPAPAAEEASAEEPKKKVIKAKSAKKKEVKNSDDEEIPF
jgi:hypothetical protein